MSLVDMPIDCGSTKLKIRIYPVALFAFHRTDSEYLRSLLSQLVVLSLLTQWAEARIVASKLPTSNVRTKSILYYT